MTTAEVENARDAGFETGPVVEVVTGGSGPISRSARLGLRLLIGCTGLIGGGLAAGLVSNAFTQSGPEQVSPITGYVILGAGVVSAIVTSIVVRASRQDSLLTRVGWACVTLCVSSPSCCFSRSRG